MDGDNYSREGGRQGGSRNHQLSRTDRNDRSDRGDRERGERSRRRSRSPADYRGGRGLRRDAEADSYSSSRSHRDREREDRYSGRDRRDREPWDRDRERERDRGVRREVRRDEDRQLQRDAHDTRPRGGRRERERDFDRDRDRRRSPSPPPKKRGATPDLTDVTSVLERKRRLTQWDLKPPGYENVTAEQAKLSGMFPLPGAPRQQTADPTKIAAFISQPTTMQATTSVLKPSNSRQSKRLVVSNLPSSVTDESLIYFFNLQLNGLNVIDDSDPCILSQISSDGSFAMVEFKEPIDATVALALNGISMEAEDASGSGQSGLSIQRPKDYIVPAVVDYSVYHPGVVSNVVIDTPFKIAITNIPSYLSDEQVTELLVSFGELRAFVLLKDRSTEESRGVAFCEYTEPQSTDVAIQGLNGMDLGDRKLRVQKASIGITQVTSVEMGVNAMSLLAGTISQEASDVSRVVQLLNMVTAEELVNNDDYEDICEDVTEECAKFGPVMGLKVPRPASGGRHSPGVGKIFVKFDSRDSATKALKALAGRKFSDRTVVATYFPEENFEVDAW